jgi:serine/threonine protein kinase
MASFGRYEIEEKLGEGAMGVVYRARDLTLGRVVALKLLSAEGAEDELHKRFHREAEAVGRLDHPNIVKIYDLAESDGRLYMAMELLEGHDLRALIEERAEIPLVERVRILEEICRGLGYAHGKGVVHRDVKPANILVNAAGRVKVLDFGLARVATRATITRRGVILGTPDYMCPEQAMGKTVKPCSDIFSTGAVFYEFLTLQKPFIGKTLHSVLYQILSEKQTPVLTLNPEIPARLAELVSRMLQKKPEHRYQTMEDVASDLRVIRLALYRSRGRSTMTVPRPTPSAAAAEETRVRTRQHLARAREHYKTGRFGQAIVAVEEALALDDDLPEAGEMLWRAARKLQRDESRSQPDLGSAARVAALLEQAAPGAAEPGAGQAVAELALIAPDDPRVRALVRQRGTPRR